MQDIALDNSKGYYDISVTNGDFTSTDGLDTAILVSMFVDKRAAESEVPEASLRRGWIGNEQNADPNYELGSKLWLLYQSRSTREILNRSIDLLKGALLWMIEDSLVKDISVSGTRSGGGITLSVTFLRFDKSTFSHQFSLWENTSLV